MEHASLSTQPLCYTSKQDSLLTIVLSVVFKHFHLLGLKSVLYSYSSMERSTPTFVSEEVEKATACLHKVVCFMLKQILVACLALFSMYIPLIFMWQYTHANGK